LRKYGKILHVSPAPVKIIGEELRGDLHKA